MGLCFRPCTPLRNASSRCSGLHQPQKPNGAWSNLLDTQIALVEAEEGIAIIPSFGMPACRNRRITTSQLINPVVRFEFHMISRRGRQLPPGAEEFTSFLKSYIATWAGRAGVL
jgi:DNA-binding transcriptional LysR family regulator